MRTPARPVAVPDAPDYTDTIEVTARPGDTRTPEQWARSTFEGAPGPARWFLLLGWRAGLGLRLGPQQSAEHVLGWRIAAADSEVIRLAASSPLLNAGLTLRVSGSTVSLATEVHYLRRAARPLWTLALVPHRRIAPYLLARAARPRPSRPLVIRSQRLISPVARRLARYFPGQAVLETTGRRSGRPRPTPVGGRLDGSTFWLVSEFGRQSNYVRNIEAEPRVRLQLRGRWHTGTATILDGDDPRERLRQLPRYNSLVVRLLGTDLLTVRIELDRD